ncbi:Lpg1974 family pore-forming outer membrane protein [Legionella maceachernii]|uniref:Major outer membrane protein n=2 Tax=Legionella TaxID=445 RepID=A0A0W0VVQ0_9GAMM|nr:Lpg1974 family pore-forming outer membrane protein [Legionella maceachernii]KTD24204.1 major outer membrane protein [Legionella maceachernii]SJZ89059.1 Legionella pneumophila major outer membrane protein precursor [Legionella maceachernii]SUO98781.1 Legionella pneumophila major outer membrane protein precursor [Legionella maceachernii]
MSYLKKTAVAVLALSSSAVFAGTMGPVCTPGNVTVPCERTAWDFGVQALYLDTTYDNGSPNWWGGYGSGYDFGGFNETRWNNNWRNDWNWGFKLEGSYHFHTGNDINVNWYHLTNSNNDHHNNSGWGWDNNRNRGPRWDAVNVELGQHVDFSEWKVIRFHGGVQYARIADHRRNHNNGFGAFGAGFGGFGTGFGGFGTSFFGANAFGNHHEARFNGFGPRFGADMSYMVGNGFSVYANGATALLIGSSRPAFQFDPAFPVSLIPVAAGFPVLPAFGTLPGTGFAALNTFNHHNRTIMVPELEGKLGAKYTYAMASGDLTLDVGYMWVNYFNARHTVFNHGTIVDGFGVRRHLGFEDRSSNVAFNGPYAGVKWVGNFV